MIKCITVIAIFLLSVILSDCGPHLKTKSGVIRIKGSDTMQILMNKLAEEYMKSHPGVAIYTAGSSTGIGFQSLINGEIDICSASRPILPNETVQIAQKYYTVGVAHIIAKDALSIYTHPENPVDDLTNKQLKQIFTGEFTNWKSVGGNDAEIKVFIRPPNSGTSFYFREHLLEGDEYTSHATILSTTKQIVVEILKNPAGIGYGGIAYGTQLTHCRVNGISPSADNVRYGLYPISRYMYLYTVKKPRGNKREFIDWIISKTGQKIVKEVGYIPLLSGD